MTALLAATITPEFRYANYAEGVLWMVVGVVTLFVVRQRGAQRLAFGMLATLVVFGVSDWVETTTGAWYRPWWLFVWKAVCVAILVGSVGWLWWRSRSSP